MHDSAVNEGELAMFGDKNLLFISSLLPLFMISVTPAKSSDVYVKSL